ncbi:MAG TPA: DUF177 domain-containing protein [Thermodesulfovibrionales bacterium]|jgi:uncharacterized protein|nr:DUF177 domain-containing protein [Thermodesulfovibrionales bacterium]
MKILLSDITDEGLDLEFSEAFEAGPFKLLSPARASLHIEKFRTEVFVKGTVKASVGLECSRCLKPFSQETDLDVNVVYHPTEELKGEERHEIKDDELDMGFYEGDELDVQELVKEQIILSIPIKPLCSETCKGFCPFCGTELSADTCSCRQKETDPRFAILRTLLDKGKE